MISNWNVWGISFPAMANLLVIGSVVPQKGLAPKANLLHETCGQIDNAEKMFKFSKTEIKNIEFICIERC